MTTAPETSYDIYLVRHGEASARWGDDPDPGLSELGRAQARRRSAALCAQMTSPVKLISSPMRRARETAIPFAEALATDVITDPVFGEIPSPVPLADRQNWLLELMRGTWSTQDRAVLAWRDRILQRMAEIDSSCIISTHFMVLNVIVGALDRRAETLCFRPANASVTQLRKDTDGLHLIALGDEMKTVVN